MEQLEPNLTMMESDALLHPSTPLNLTDGHPRMPLSDSQRLIVERLPAMFEEASLRPFLEIEQRAQSALFTGLGQLSAPLDTGRIISVYSSTVALDIVARALRARTDTVRLLHPTFDNLADLLVARGLRPEPITQEQLEDNDAWPPASPAGAMLLVSPNNPTGWVMSPSVLHQTARRCERAGVVLIIDASFRGQDARAQFDTYEILDSVGGEWVVVEDTGKLWPIHELKVGFIAWSANSRLEIARAASEVLLSVSPLVLLLVTALAEDGVAGGYSAMHALLRRNRATVADLVMADDLSLTDPDARISVARLSLPATGSDAEAICAELRRHDVHLLPCRRFFWANPGDGARQIRISLARPPEQIRAAAKAVVEVCRTR